MKNTTGGTPPVSQKEMDIDYKIQIATETLDRNIDFITNCDNKASIVLAVLGVLLSIILSGDGRIKKMLSIVRNCWKLRNFASCLYLFILLGGIICTAIGVFRLGLVLKANITEKTGVNNNLTSRIFFSGIISKDYSAYHDAFSKMTKEDLLKDLTEEIYINAQIATTKYGRYKWGMRLAGIGFVVFVVSLIIGLSVWG